MNGLLVDWQIAKLVEDRQLISNFVPEQVAMVDGEPVISFGLSSAGYDLRVADEYKIFTPVTGSASVIDPKKVDPKFLYDFVGKQCIIPPHSFALARSVERIKMPRRLTALCLGKSTYARNGINTNFTPFEAGWEGWVTIEISNTTPLPATIYSNEGIAQVMFFAHKLPLLAYDQRKGGGKYQNQVGVVVSKV